MKAKRTSLAVAALLAAGGLWFAVSAWRAPASHKPSLGAGIETPRGAASGPDRAASLPGASHTGPAPGPNNRSEPDQVLRPPDPSRRFLDFTPEQRVQFARQGHGPGG